MKVKLTVLGGGGVRSILLARSIVQRSRDLGIDHVVFMDNNETKLNIFGAMSKKAASLIDPDLKFELTTDPVEAVKDADYIITTIRVGGDEARVIDERTALRYGVLGQETTGASGFAMALRSIPVLKEYCGYISRYAKKDVMVFNFTNPAGLVTQAMRDLGFEFVYGICDAPSGFLRQLAKCYGQDVKDFEMECFGLNHLSYYKSIKLKGNDITDGLIHSDFLYTDTDMRYFEPELVKRTGCLLNEYLYYYYYREKPVGNIVAAGSTRGETIQRINSEMISELSKIDINKDFDAAMKIFSKYHFAREASYMANETSIKRNQDGHVPVFDIFEKDAGGYAGVALALIEAKASGKSSEMILCVPNNGTVDWLEDGDIVEVSCYIGPDGVRPKKISELPVIPTNLIRNVKLYERLTVKSILTKDKQMAIDALTVHPLVNSYSIAKGLVNDYLNAHKKYAGEWN
ncbi:6-phospho-beta-glucosidase [Pseudoclostridium thermosuccinogenes]|uniref:family 4 glycosyl hydrolase n=1 Tax=Clostridium thermosuccinogenes TaxID=84032 RepID=UPI002FD963EF